MADVTTEIAREGDRLAGGFLGDPADCLIIATTRSLGAALVTCDQRILDYAESGDLRIVDARR
jgi:PIN domain nuclease of toxin-antitoxin system